jgi:hypoxanthine phosphoribosyltransferase
MEPLDVRDREPYDVDQLRLDDTYRSDIEKILVSRGEIEDRVARIAEAVSNEYRDRPQGEFYPVCVLKGAIRFFVDLLRELDLDGPYSEGVVNASRYGTGPVSETAEVSFPRSEAIAGKHVLLVEDIIDEGHTLATILDRIEEYDPRSVEVAALFDKAPCREVTVDPAFTGFIIPDEFVVGYGLDCAERYRDFRHLGVLDGNAVEE